MAGLVLLVVAAFGHCDAAELPSATGSAQYISGVTPLETGLGGEAVLRLTGVNLFWWQTEVWLVPKDAAAGSADRRACAVVKEQSDPDGSLLSCRAPPNAPGAYRLALVHKLGNSTSDFALAQNSDIQYVAGLTPTIPMLTDQP